MSLSYKKLKFIASFVVVGIFLYLTLQYFDGRLIWNGVVAIIQSPFILVTILVVYFLSFCLRALAWKWYLNGRPKFSTCLLGVFYSLFFNHLLPIKAGDLIRMKIMSARDEMSSEDVAHSVIILRILDMVFLMAFTFVGLVVLDVQYQLPKSLIAGGSIAAILLLAIVVKLFPAFLKRQVALLRQAFKGSNGIWIILAVGLSWFLEGAILYGTCIVYDKDLSIFESVFANSVTVSGQIFQITPGGIANYESFLVFSLRLFGITMQEGYNIAIVTHAIKFFFSYLVGIIALWVYPIPFKTLLNWASVRGVRKK